MSTYSFSRLVLAIEKSQDNHSNASRSANHERAAEAAIAYLASCSVIDPYREGESRGATDWWWDGDAVKALEAQTVALLAERDALAEKLRRVEALLAVEGSFEGKIDRSQVMHLNELRRALRGEGGDDE